jgi:pimeloyl-ACP methyl ester carboxylesterase
MIETETRGRSEPQSPLLPPALDAELQTTELRNHVGRVAFYSDTTAARHATRPLVLFHSVNASASSFEMRPIFDGFRGERPVYALDLPGFGLSPRGERRYDAPLYERAVERFCIDVAERRHGSTPDVVALSLSCELACARLGRGDKVHSLVLISPTGLGDRGKKRSAALRTLAKSPLGQALYSVAKTRASIRWFLKKSFHGPIDEALALYAERMAQAPGAYRAPLVFLSGELFHEHAYEDIYTKVEVPTLVVFDEEDPYTSYDRLPELLQARHNFSALAMPQGGAMPHFEQPEKMNAALATFFAAVRTLRAAEQRTR